MDTGNLGKIKKCHKVQKWDSNDRNFGRTFGMSAERLRFRPNVRDVPFFPDNVVLSNFQVPPNFSDFPIFVFRRSSIFRMSGTSSAPPEFSCVPFSPHNMIFANVRVAPNFQVSWFFRISYFSATPPELIRAKKYQNLFKNDKNDNRHFRKNARK